MKNKLLLPLLSAVTLFATPTLAQDKPSSKPQATAPYKTSIGFRTSFAGPTGWQPELRIKHFVKPETALELQLGKWGYRESYQASLHYLWQPQLLSFSRLRPYAGLGVGVVGTTRSNYYESHDMQVGAVLLGSIGVEYSFRKLPLAVSLDYRHSLININTGSFGPHHPVSNMNTLGIGLKYTLGK